MTQQEPLFLQLMQGIISIWAQQSSTQRLCHTTPPTSACVC